MNVGFMNNSIFTIYLFLCFVSKVYFRRIDNIRGPGSEDLKQTAKPSLSLYDYLHEHFYHNVSSTKLNLK